MRQFSPSRIERQLLTQVFECVVVTRRDAHEVVGDGVGDPDTNEVPWLADDFVARGDKERGMSEHHSPHVSSPRVAICARVSSEQQAQEQTIASQVAALRQRVADEGFALSEELCFLDDGVSGSTLTRPALERLRDAAYVGGFQKMYVQESER